VGVQVTDLCGAPLRTLLFAYLIACAQRISDTKLPTDCLTNEHLKHDDHSYEGYEFCYTEASSHHHVAMQAFEAVKYCVLFVVGATLANGVSQYHRQGRLYFVSQSVVSRLQVQSV
jgi:hypothetical protein